MKRLLIAAALWLVAPGAHAQVFASGVSLQQVQAIVPQPSSAISAAPVTNGAIGTPGVYVPADAAQKLVVQTANTTLDASCNWSVTFGQTFTSASPVIHAAVVLASPTQPIPCIVATRSSTVQTGKCFPAQNTLLSLSIITAGLTLAPFASSCAAGMPVMVIGREPTQ